MNNETENQWIEWSGGECPVDPTTIVEVAYRDAETEVMRAGSAIFGNENWWRHDGEAAYDTSADLQFRDHGCDIIAYRVVKEAIPSTQPAKAVADVLLDCADELATIVADRCHGNRKIGQAPQRYAIIWQAARLGVLEAAAKAQAAQVQA